MRAVPKLIARLRRNAGGRFPHELIALCTALGRVGAPAVPALLELFAEGNGMGQYNVHDVFLEVPTRKEGS